MPVTISGKSVDGYNKSPQKPEAPDPELFQTAIETSDGKLIWRSLPQVDRLSFEAVLLEKHFSIGGSSKPVSDVAHIGEIANGLAGAQLTYSDKSPYKPKDGPFATKFLVPLGSRGSGVYFEIKRVAPGDAPAPIWKLFVQLTPRKLKQDGLSSLMEVLALATPSGFSVSSMLGDARIRQLDVALDFVGVRPIEMWMSADKRAGKRLDIFGPDGELETSYLHSFKPLPKVPKASLRKPLGALIARLYSRDRERAAHGKPPPYSAGPSTRLEVSKRRFSPALYLPDLASVGDAFSRVRLGYVADYGGEDPALWSRYVTARRSMSQAGAAATLGLSDKVAKNYESLLRKNPGDLLPHQDMQVLFGQGLTAVGLDILIAPKLEG